MFFPRTRFLYFRIKLDIIGSDTWKAIDGERNVQQIADHIRKQSGLDPSLLTELEDGLKSSFPCSMSGVILPSASFWT